MSLAESRMCQGPRVGVAQGTKRVQHGWSPGKKDINEAETLGRDQIQKGLLDL